MTIKVVIERTVKPDKKDKLLEILKEMSPKAIQQPGYVKGETLCSIENPNTHMIISTWHSLQDWRRWEDSPEPPGADVKHPTAPEHHATDGNIH